MMANVQAEVFQAFRSVNVPEDVALAAASALAHRDASVSTIAADTALLKVDVSTVKADLAKLKADSAVVKWMLGFVLAFQIAVLFKILAH